MIEELSRDAPIVPAMTDQAKREGATDAPARSRAAIAEGLIALAAFLLLILPANLRALVAACWGAVADGVIALARLSIVDPPTLVPGLASIAKALLLFVPVGRMIALSPRWRIAWIPALAVAGVLVYGIAIPAFSTAIMWLLGLGAAVLAWVAVRTPALRALAFLPWIVAVEPTLGHSPLGDSFWIPARLEARCADNDGVRPVGVPRTLLGTRYFGVTPFSRELALLHGERHTMWVRLPPDAPPRLEPELHLTGNFWQGCVRDGVLWLTHNGRLCRFTPPAAPGDPGQGRCERVRLPAGIGPELDYVDPICPRDRDTVLVSQLVRGGMLEVDPETWRATFVPVIDGLNLQVVPYEDRLIGITTGELFQFDLSGHVAWRTPAGLVALGVDVCREDGTIAVTDFAGRLRLFSRDGVFERGVLLDAPRRVAFSPDCAQVVASSGNDRDVVLLRRRDLAVEHRWQLGPGLRDLVFVDDHRVAVADACTITLLDVRAEMGP